MNSEEKNKHDPDYAVPPGETLLETMDHQGLSRKELAQRMNCSVKTVRQLAQGKASLTAETALKLEKITGIHSSFWNNAESNYRKRLARNEEQKAIHSQVDWVKRFSYVEMSTLNFVPKTKNKEERVDNLLRFFGVASPKRWESIYGQLQGAARESKSCKSELGDFSAWLRAGEIKSPTHRFKTLLQKKLPKSSSTNSATNTRKSRRNMAPSHPTLRQCRRCRCNRPKAAPNARLRLHSLANFAESASTN